MTENNSCSAEKGNLGHESRRKHRKVCPSGSSLNTCGYLDDECGKMSTWCWPAPPKTFCGPCKYTRETLNRIPTGSLYLAATKGPLSEMNARITGSPYNMVGLVFQSKTEGKEGTYVYTVDQTFTDSDRVTNKVSAINLIDLITADNIIHHAVLPLKDFDDYCHEGPRPLGKDSDIGEDHGHRVPVAAEAVDAFVDRFEHGKRKAYRDQKGGDEKGKHYRRRKYGPVCTRYDEPSESVEICESNSSSSSTSCPDDSYEDCNDAKSWKCKLRDTRNEILKTLFKKYRDLTPEHDGYQTLASIVGLPVAEALRTKNAFTAPELIGLILFQAGLIWDDSFATGNKNPVCCFNECFFQQLAKDSSETCDGEVFVTLTTPNAYATIQYGDNYTVCDRKRNDYPEMIYHNDSSDEEESEIKPHHNRRYVPTVSDKICKKKRQPHVDTEDQIRHNLREYLNDAFKNGYNCNYKQADHDEKGGDEEKGYCDYYSCDDEAAYKRCYYPAKWCQTECVEPPRYWPKPCKRDVHARTILFGSLRPVDFLLGYYQARGIDPNGWQNIKDCKQLTGRRGAAGELVAVVQSLAAERAAGDLLDYDVNKLNTSWFHDNLIPIELCNNPDEDCADRIEHECRVLKDLVCQLDRDFVQKRMLHVDNSCLSGSYLLRICRRISELSAELHAIASDCDTHVNCNDKYYHVRECPENDGCGEFKFKIRVDNCDPCATDYLVVLHKYMWGSGWKYDWKGPFSCEPERYTDICCRIRRVIRDLRDLKNRIPVTCILLEVVVCMLEQADCLYKFLCSCRSYCCGHRRQRRSYGYNKHKGHDDDDVIARACLEKSDDTSNMTRN